MLLWQQSINNRYGFFEALGFKHYQVLNSKMIVSLEKIILIEIRYLYRRGSATNCDRTIGEIADTLEPKTYTSREFIFELGKYLKSKSKKKFINRISIRQKRSNFLSSCKQLSWFRISNTSRKKSEKHITIDTIKGRELTEIKFNQMYQA